MVIHLRNPHSVLAALERRPQSVVEVRLSSQPSAGAWDTVLQLATARHIPVLLGADHKTGRRRDRREESTKSGRTGLAEATVKERSGVSLTELFAETGRQVGGSGIWLALDRLQDPHNVGAIFRSAAFFGVKGVVLTRDQSAPLNGTVYDVASGGMEYVPFSVQTNLSRAIEQAKKAGVWVLGTSERAEEDIAEVARDRPWLLVLGNEEKGLRRLTLENCDCVCRLSSSGEVASLNVSVAAGVLMASLTSPG